MIDQQLHNTTQYRIPRLEQQIEETIKHICSFLVDCSEKNWDGYNAEQITVDTIKFSALVLRCIEKWWKDNIGFLNNRSIDFEATPTNDGYIHLNINYNDCIQLHIYVKQGQRIVFIVQPVCIYRFDGTKTIADRDFDIVFPEEQNCLKDTIHLKDITEFLNHAFYVHKWKF